MFCHVTWNPWVFSFHHHPELLLFVSWGKNFQKLSRIWWACGRVVVHSYVTFFNRRKERCYPRVESSGAKFFQILKHLADSCSLNRWNYLIDPWISMGEVRNSAIPLSYSEQIILITDFFYFFLDFCLLNKRILDSCWLRCSKHTLTGIHKRRW